MGRFANALNQEENKSRFSGAFSEHYLDQNQYQPGTIEKKIKNTAPSLTGGKSKTQQAADVLLSDPRATGFQKFIGGVAKTLGVIGEPAQSIAAGASPYVTLGGINKEEARSTLGIPQRKWWERAGGVAGIGAQIAAVGPVVKSAGVAAQGVKGLAGFGKALQAGKTTAAVTEGALFGLAQEGGIKDRLKSATIGGALGGALSKIPKIGRSKRLKKDFSKIMDKTFTKAKVTSKYTKKLLNIGKKLEEGTKLKFGAKGFKNSAVHEKVANDIFNKNAVRTKGDAALIVKETNEALRSIQGSSRAATTELKDKLLEFTSKNYRKLNDRYRNLLGTQEVMKTGEVFGLKTKRTLAKEFQNKLDDMFKLTGKNFKIAQKKLQGELLDEIAKVGNAMDDEIVSLANKPINSENLKSSIEGLFKSQKIDLTLSPKTKQQLFRQATSTLNNIKQQFGKNSKLAPFIQKNADDIINLEKSITKKSGEFNFEAIQEFLKSTRPSKEANLLRELLKDDPVIVKNIIKGRFTPRLTKQFDIIRKMAESAVVYQGIRSIFFKR